MHNLYQEFDGFGESIRHSSEALRPGTNYRVQLSPSEDLNRNGISVVKIALKNLRYKLSPTFPYPEIGYKWFSIRQIACKMIAGWLGTSYHHEIYKNDITSH
jgi:hypothetical protein